jgi:regulation of enolase protein 1 (concanavalin A-like superfamily)
MKSITRHLEFVSSLSGRIRRIQILALTLFAWVMGDLAVLAAGTPISQFLPFDMPSVSSLRAANKKVFSHYFTPYPISIDNKDPSVDYYTLQYLNPNGESGIHAGYGGFLRQRPLGRPVRPESNWKDLDAQLEVQRAIEVGLDGFTTDLLNGQIDRVQRLMDAANVVDPGFKIVLMPDMNSILTSNALVSAVQTLAAYPAAYRLSDGRLVVSPFNAQKQTAAWWQGWLTSMAGRGINIAFVPLFQNWRAYASAYAPISYGFSDWGDRSAAVNATSANWLNAAADAHTYVPIWMHPVAPQDARPRSHTYWEAQNTATFRNTWQLGAINKADWAQAITWNDYSEQAEMSPSTGTQYLFYDLSAFHIVWFKNGTPPPIVRDCIYYSHRQAHTTAAPDLTKQTVGAFTVAGGQSASNHIEAYVFLTANATLEIVNNGVTTSFPVTAPTSVVKIVVPSTAGAAGQPIFRLIRNSQVVSSVQSPFPINNTITYQNMLYHGGSSLRPPVTQVPQAYWPRNPTLPPAAPTGLSATAGNAQVTLSWTAVSGATSYTIKRATTSGGPYTTVGSATSTSFINTGLNNGTLYYYVVAAVNSGGSSANSAQVSATPVAPDLIVTGISWTPASPVAGQAVTFSATIKNQGTTPTPAGVIHGVSFWVDSAQVNWSDTNTTSLAAGASRTLTVNSGPTGSSTWTATAGAHSVRAYVDDVNRIAEGNENNNTLTNSMTVLPPPPPTPTGLAATPGDAQVALSWNSSAGATSYNVKRATVSGGPYTTIGSPTLTSFTDTTALNGTNYYYVVSAVNSGGQSANSSQVSAIPVGGPPDLIVTGITWAPTSPVASQAVTFSAVVKNQGTGPTPAGIILGVSFWVDGTQVSWSDTNTTALAPGASRTLAANGGPGGLSTWTATAGAHSVLAFVDDVNRIAESNETNNNFTNSVTVTVLPVPWVTSDIGAVGAAGSASWSNNVFTVAGSGADIWGAADEFRYAYQTASGDCTIVARVAAVQNTDVWAKAGVMVRETLNANSAHAAMYITPGSGASFQSRTNTGSTTVSTTVTGFAAPYWVRVARVGSTFTASRSPDGSTWTTVGSTTITMGANVYIGLAVCSHLDGTVCTATMSNVTATP